ncbi:MAG: vWA domain-containing protein [Pseudolysinimonas sp.]
MTSESATEPLDAAQRVAWEAAERLWSVRMHEARQAPAAGRPSFAWFSFPPQIVIDPVLAAKEGVDTDLATVFAHELGHHLLSPSTRIAALKIQQQMARAILACALDSQVTDLDGIAAELSNIWSDMLINDRVVELQRSAVSSGTSKTPSDSAAEPGMVTLWRRLRRSDAANRMWWVVLRAYEELWGLADDSLCDPEPPARPAVDARLVDPPPPVEVEPKFQALQRKLEAAQAEAAAARLSLLQLASTHPEADASLLAETVRSFGSDPISGALRFGMITAPYLLESGRLDPDVARGPGGCAGEEDRSPATAAELGEVFRDGRLREVPLHPGLLDRGVGSVGGTGGGQSLGIADTLKLYSGTAPDQVLTAWYLNEARPWVRPYRQPSLTPPSGTELPGALEQWDIGDDLDQLDLLSSLAASPRLIPGVTTRRRTRLEDPLPIAKESVELDLYIDSSGSMPSPQANSPAIVAAVILVESVLSGGGRVRVTSFSGPGQVGGTPRSTRNRGEALAAVLLFFGGGTTFPLDLLADRYVAPAAAGVRRHLVVLSDDGLTSLFGEGQPQYASVATEVRRRLDTATLIVLDARKSISVLAAAAGYDIEYITRIADAPAACATLAARIAAYSGPPVGRVPAHG